MRESCVCRLVVRMQDGRREGQVVGGRRRWSAGGGGVGEKRRSWHISCDGSTPSVNAGDCGEAGDNNGNLGLGCFWLGSVTIKVFMYIDFMPQIIMSNALHLSSDLSDSECFQKQDILEDTVILDHEKDIDEVKLKSSDLEKFEEQCKENVDISSPNVVLDKQEFKELSERGTNVEITGCDNSELAFCDSKSIVHGEKNSSFVKGDQSQLEEYSNAHFSSSNPRESQCFEKHDILDDTGLSFVEVLSISGDLVNFEAQSKEKVDVSIPNDACNEQKVKEVEERDVNGELTVADEVSSSLEEIQRGKEEKEEAPDQQLVLSEDIHGSQGCNDSKFPEVPCVQPSQPLMAVKPKRRLRPASSVMLKNINILDFDDATTMPKQHNGKRGGNEDSRKITQEAMTFLEKRWPLLLIQEPEWVLHEYPQQTIFNTSASFNLC
ncbi:hypothetical protein R6Q57_011072 [Mikania cordata]